MSWRVTGAYRETASAKALRSLDTIFQLDGEPISSDPISRMLRVDIGDTSFYVKRYTAGGKYLRRYVGQSRVSKEWRSLMHFADVGIPTPALVAYGEDRVFGIFRRGALVTEQVTEAPSLAQLAARKDARFRNPDWIRQVSEQVADYTRRLHEGGFAHSDLNWRNVLIKLDEPPQALLIDCPAGGRWFGPMLSYRKVKDLAHLDEQARRYLSRSHRLRFFMRYRRISRLEHTDKQLLRRILRYGEYLDSKDRLFGLTLAAAELNAWLANLPVPTPSAAPSDRNSPNPPRQRRQHRDCKTRRYKR